MKICITGANGLVGSHLTPRLEEKHEVLALDRVFDIRIELELPKVDLVINLAALNSSKESIEQPREYFETNVLGNYNMLEAARLMGAKYMYLTSPKAIELNPYGVSKFCAEQWCLAYKQTYGMPILLNRIGNLYGPGGDNFWVNIFMKKAKEGEQIEIWGNQSRDMLYIDDLIDLLVDQVDNFDLYTKYEHVIPAGGGEENVLSTEDLVHWLEYENVKRVPALETLTDNRVTDNSLVTSINGWAPRTGLEEGLEKTYESI
jgi:UDP-glucose 4-epimerase